MEIEVLGSGGALPTPQHGCTCAVCTQARERGVPHSRMGPSYYIHGPELLIDTPEEARLQLDRAGIAHVPACIYSHWHPDHTAGRRVFERNMEPRTWPRITHPTDVYLPQQVAVDARKWLGMWDQLSFLESLGTVRLHEMEDGASIRLNGVTITPVRLKEDYVYAFLLEERGRRALIVPDELHGWHPPAEVIGVDVAVLPMGIPEFDPFGEERWIPTDHPLLRTEETYLETLDVIRELRAERVILSHIEEPFRLTYEDYDRLAEELQAQGLPVVFAYDTMRVRV